MSVQRVNARSIGEGAISDETEFCRLLGTISGADKVQQAQDELQTALRKYGLTNIAYVAINLPTKRREGPLIGVTYSAEWERHCNQNSFVSIDPIRRAGLGGVLPIDWAELKRENPIIKKFFAEVQEFDIYHDGVSFPIRGRHGEFGMLSATISKGNEEWENTKLFLMRNLMTTAYNVHDWILKKELINDKNETLDSLTSREKDCLRWRALGKTDLDISEMLSISERTVKFHLENARRKLDATNTTHAVAKALGRGLLAIP